MLEFSQETFLDTVLKNKRIKKTEHGAYYSSYSIGKSVRVYIKELIHIHRYNPNLHYLVSCLEEVDVYFPKDDRRKVSVRETKMWLRHIASELLNIFNFYIKETINETKKIKNELTKNIKENDSIIQKISKVLDNSGLYSLVGYQGSLFDFSSLRSINTIDLGFVKCEFFKDSEIGLYDISVFKYIDSYDREYSLSLMLEDDIKVYCDKSAYDCFVSDVASYIYRNKGGVICFLK